MVAGTRSTALMFAAALALTGCAPQSAAQPAAPSPSAATPEASPGGFHCLIATGCGAVPSPSEASEPVAAAEPSPPPAAPYTPYSSPAPPITPAAGQQPQQGPQQQAPIQQAPPPANPQPLQCPAGQLAIEFTSLTTIPDQENDSDTVTIDGAVANSTSQPIYITPLRVYPLGSIQVDLSAWALYGSQTSPTPVVVSPGQTVTFRVREGITNTYNENINTWMFNPGYTQLAFTTAPYASSCSVAANAIWGSPIQNH